jgi:hypothetical protein
LESDLSQNAREYHHLSNEDANGWKTKHIFKTTKQNKILPILTLPQFGFPDFLKWSNF